MEAVSILCLGGALAAVYATHKSEQQKELRLRKAFLIPKALPAVIAASDIPDTSQLRVVAVHILHVEMHGAGIVAGDRLSVLAKYGDKGAASSCDTMEVRGAIQEDSAHTPPAVIANFGATCLFLFDKRCTPLVRLRVQKQGRCGKRVVAKAEFYVPELALRSDTQEAYLPLRRARGLNAGVGEVVGRARVAIAVHKSSKGDLVRCLHMMDAKQDGKAFVTDSINKAPVVRGRVVPASTEVWQGVQLID